MRKSVLFVSALMAAGLVSVASLAGVKKSPAGETALAPEFQLKKVESILAQKQRRSQTYQSSCLISPQKVYHISPKVDGQITYIRSNENEVKKGELLLEIENESVHYQYQVALNNLRLKELNLKRYSQLTLAQSKVEIDELKLGVDNLKAEVTYYKSLVDSMKVYAPEDGFFETPQFKLQDRVSVGQQIIQYYGNAVFEVSAQVPLQIFSDIDLNQPLSLSEVNGTSKIAEARYSHHDPDENGEFVTLFGTLAQSYQPQRSLFEKCTTSFALNRSEEGIFLDNKYVYLDYRGFYVFKLNGRRVKKNYVHVAWYDDGILELQSGINPGDMIATAGSFKLLDNELVRFELVEQ